MAMILRDHLLGKWTNALMSWIQTIDEIVNEGEKIDAYEEMM
jgi:hypothetical protein